jgi:uncharacterized membrane protein
MKQPTSHLDRAIALIPWGIAALFGAVAIHLVAILAMPMVTTNSAYDRLVRPEPVGKLVLLPRATPKADDTAFSDPFAALALCRFDLNKGPLRLRAQADGDHPLSVSVRLDDGVIIYSANDRQAPHGRFDLLIVTQAQADAQDADSTSEAPENELRLISPGINGFVLIRAMSLGEGDYKATAARRAKIQCSVEKPPS